MFSQSNLTVIGGNFVGVEGDYHSNSHIQKRTGIEILLDGVAEGALHNSGERFNPPKCHPNTRTTVLQEIMDWIQNQDPSSLDFMWIYGPAGSGKSAIAQSIAELCYELGLLLGTFFFSRSVAGRNDDKRFVATIAYQIALACSEARPLIEKAVEHDPALLSRDLETQLKALIIAPLSKTLKTLGLHNRPGRRLIIVDGLDECQDPKSQTTIIHAFTQLITLHKLPFSILFASRAEYHIREAFGAQPFETSLCRIALDNTLWRADDDIREFLNSRFKQIRETHHMRTYIPRVWPSREAIDKLVAKSSGQFIYASTVIKYVDSHGHWPMDRLDAVLGLQSVKNGTPFAELDNLYMQILSPVENYCLLSSILGFLLQVTHSVVKSPWVIDRFFSLQRGSVYLALSDLHSIIDVPENETLAIKMTHASFGDFLFDPSRSGKYFLDPSCVHANLAIWCMEDIAKHQRTSATYDKYALPAVVHHCSQARLTPELMERLSSFNFLQWIKCALMTDDRIATAAVKRLPRYFMWLSCQVYPGTQEILRRHVEAFDQCLLSDLQNSHYSKNVIWCYMTFEGRLTLERSAWLLGERPHQLLGKPGFISKIDCFLPWDPMGDYAHFLRQFFFDPHRAGKYTMTRSTHRTTTLLVLELLKSKLQMEHEPQNMLQILSCLGPPLLQSPPSNNILKCVNSILSGLNKSSMEGYAYDLAPRAALLGYIQKCIDDPSFSVRKI